MNAHYSMPITCYEKLKINDSSVPAKWVIIVPSMLRHRAIHALGPISPFHVAADAGISSSSLSVSLSESSSIAMGSS